MGYLSNDSFNDTEIWEKYRNNDVRCCHSSNQPRGNSIILECGCNPQDAIFEFDSGGLWRNRYFVLDKVLIDTSSLNRPVVKIEFSSLIYFSAEAENGGDRSVEVDLEFELERICRGGNRETVQTWRYIKSLEIENNNDFEVEISEPFTVTFCDRSCPDCCEYRMIVRPRDVDGDFEALRVVKPNLSAIAQGTCPDR